MIIWGSASDTKDLGVVETKHCDTCEKERHFKLVLQYRYSHLYEVPLVFRFPTSRA